MRHKKRLQPPKVLQMLNCSEKQNIARAQCFAGRSWSHFCEVCFSEHWTPIIPFCVHNASKNTSKNSVAYSVTSHTRRRKTNICSKIRSRVEGTSTRRADVGVCGRVFDEEFKSIIEFERNRACESYAAVSFFECECPTKASL